MLVCETWLELTSLTNCGYWSILARDLHIHLSPRPLYAFMAWYPGMGCIVGSCFNQNSLWISVTLLSCLQSCQKLHTVHTLSGKRNWERVKFKARYFNGLHAACLSLNTGLRTLCTRSEKSFSYFGVYNKHISFWLHRNMPQASFCQQVMRFLPFLYTIHT